MKRKLQHLYQINRSNHSSVLVLSQNFPFPKKVDKLALNEKVCFFAFSHLNNFFVTQHTACSFGKIDGLGGMWHNLVFRVDLKVANKACSIYN